MSTIASGFVSAPSDRPSARIKRPSASVLWISAVLPLRKVSTSPSFMAEPLGRLSVHIRYAVTCVFTFSARRALMVPSTAAAPLMSIFMLAWLASLGFSEMPPESYITPLPTSTTFLVAPAGAHTSFTTRGGSTLPAFTPTMPPHPMACSCFLSYTVARSPDLRAMATASRANRVAVRWDGGVLAWSRAVQTAVATAVPSAIPARTCASVDTSTIFRSDGTDDLSRFSSAQRCSARAAPSTNALAAPRRSSLPAPAIVVAIDAWREHARAAAAPMLRIVFSSRSLTAPIPTSTLADFDRGAGGSARVEQQRPSKPMAESCARERPTSAGTGPSLATGMAMTAVPVGTDADDVNDVRMPPLYVGRRGGGSAATGC